ncbi:hypothetical protein [Oricola thermophila]|uniref:Uncharacterized protein n=1 Tax=Oricola thermophila TaxID=2742145 RepID=A0A6N1VHE7_9HYPH|nr:hypothetical protein [Oricola thermophila]QKV18732.1 hypothetical protein HTY61_09860 [Oricola thermophila]
MSKADRLEKYTLFDLRLMCERAAKVLVAEHGFRADEFVPADGDETVYAPPGLIHEDSSHPRLKYYCTPLPGTKLYWSYAPLTGEGDCELPSEILSGIEFWSTFDPDEYQVAHGDAAEAAE